MEKNQNHNLLMVTSLILTVAFTSGCASSSNPGGLTEREVGGLTGAGVGAGTGAIIGSATGNAAVGTAIGAPIGLLAGGLVGEGMRRTKENAKQEMREEMLQQQYAQQHQQIQPSVAYQVSGVETHSKYNPKTGGTFPERYQFDPVTGDKLEPVKKV